MRAPLIVRSVVNGRRYITSALFMALGVILVALGASGTLGLPPLVWAASIFLVLWGPASAANAFLGYPRLIVSGERMLIETTPFTAQRIELAGLGPAYVIHYPRNRGMATELIFRTAEAEAAHRAAEKFPYGPELGDGARTVNVNAIVGHDVEKGEALAREINAHRGLPAQRPGG